jgi:hypothetical protein
MFDLTSALFPDTAAPRLRPGPFAPLQQSAVYARAVRLLGGTTDYVMLPGSAAWVIQRRMPVLGMVGLISRGPASLSPAAATALRGTVETRHLIVNAEDPAAAEALAAAGFWQVGRPRWIATLRLAPSAEAMADRLGQKFRNRLRHGLRQRLHLRRMPLPINPRHWLFAADAAYGRKLGYHPMPPALVCAIAASRPGTAQLFVARAPTGPVAAMLFLRHGRMATYQIGWSNAAGRAASAGNVLMWQAMVALQAMGVDRLDLGAADPQTAPGLTRFKSGTGAVLRPLGGTWMSSAALPNRRRRGATDKAMGELRRLAARAAAE